MLEQRELLNMPIAQAWEFRLQLLLHYQSRGILEKIWILLKCAPEFRDVLVFFRVRLQFATICWTHAKKLIKIFGIFFRLLLSLRLQIISE